MGLLPQLSSARGVAFSSGRRCYSVLPLVYLPPNPLQKPHGTFNACFIPDQFVFDRSGKHYKETSGIQAITLAPLPLRLAAIDNRRQQLVAEDIIELMKSSNPNLARDPNAIVIGLTNEDMYSRSHDWKFAFSRWQGRFAVVSSARMNPYNLGAAPDDDLRNIRLRKMVSKNIGLLYYELPASNDPRSVMYDGINSVQDLDNMCEDL